MRPLRGRMVTAAEKQGNYEETQVVLQETVQIFSQKNDVQAVRDSGRAITELHTVTELRHKEMLESIKGACAPMVSCRDSLLSRDSDGH